MATGQNTYLGAGNPAMTPTVYDIDGFSNPATTVAQLHGLPPVNGVSTKVICYVDVGTWENWRPDASQFPAALLGASNGWPGEKWLNISPDGPDYATLQTLMLARFRMCRDNGYDAVEPDNIDGSENTTGFTITTAENNAYDEWVANAVHSLGMTVAQKNYGDQSQTLAPYFDFAIDEQCYQYSECSSYAPYYSASPPKPIFEAEYKSQPSVFCAVQNTFGAPGVFNAVYFDLNLDGNTRIPCR